MITLDNILDTYGMKKLISLTKYPSILTYHEMGNKGILQDSLTEQKSFRNCQKCYITEKIDGANSSIIVLNGDYLIGTREEIVYAKGDRICKNIANTVRPYAEKIASNIEHDNCMYIAYGETYGGKIGKSSNQYTCDETTHFRLFDVVSVSEDSIISLLQKPISDISYWREHEGQEFYSVEKMKQFAERYCIDIVPYLEVKNGKDIPTSLKDTYEWLSSCRFTKASINSHGNSEGFVIRTFGREFIRKARIEDYERTIRHEKKLNLKGKNDNEPPKH